MRRRYAIKHAVDCSAADLLILIRQALEAGKPPLTAWAWREYDICPARPLERRRIEDEDDLNENVKRGSLDIEPTGKPKGWALHIAITDELGDLLPDDADSTSGPQEIGVEMLWKEFKNFGPDTTQIEVSVDSKAAKHRFDRFLAELRVLYD